jgi:hypothetical protein
MKAKLIKTNVNYLLEDDKGVIIASTSIKKGISSLSKKNCDEIFGVVDVENWADFYGAFTKGNVDFKLGASKGFEDGFNKAMELNKDKVFTLDDMKNAMDCMMTQYFEFHEQPTTGRRDEYLKSLQQSTEIEVMIEMECKIGCEHLVLNGENSLCCGNKVPKLDSEGCLILKRAK